MNKFILPILCFCLAIVAGISKSNAQSSSDFNFDSELLAQTVAYSSPTQNASTDFFISEDNLNTHFQEENLMFLNLADLSADRDRLLAKAKRKKVLGFVFAGLGAAMIVPGIAGIAHSTKQEEVNSAGEVIGVTLGKTLEAGVGATLITGGVLSGIGSILFFSRASKLKKQASSLSLESGQITIPRMTTNDLKAGSNRYVGLKYSLNL